MVPGTGLEPASREAADFKSAMFTNFITPARVGKNAWTRILPLAAGPAKRTHDPPARRTGPHSAINPDVIGES